jgi:hypothetical protein
VLTQKTIFRRRGRRVVVAVAIEQKDVVERSVGVGENTGTGDGLGNNVSFFLALLAHCFTVPSVIAIS